MASFYCSLVAKFILLTDWQLFFLIWLIGVFELPWVRLAIYFF